MKSSIYIETIHETPLFEHAQTRNNNSVGMCFVAQNQPVWCDKYKNNNDNDNDNDNEIATKITTVSNANVIVREIIIQRFILCVSVYLILPIFIIPKNLFWQYAHVAWGKINDQNMKHVEHFKTTCWLKIWSTLGCIFFLSAVNISPGNGYRYHKIKEMLLWSTNKRTKIFTNMKNKQQKK